jgi:diacylglycerol kinase (ATP)
VKQPIPVIFNPNAGTKRRGPFGGHSAESLAELFATQGRQARVMTTTSAEDASAEVGRLVSAGEELIVVAGGDGTIGQIATELLGKDVALGVIPLGSVMNIARSLGLPLDVEQAVRLLTGPFARTVLVDVGEANGRVFYEGMSVGIHAAMFNSERHFDDGRWGSPLRPLWMAFRYRPARMDIQLDDSEPVQTRGLMAVIANGPYAGAALTVAPDARLDDGMFDVRVFRHFSKIELFRHLASIMFGRRAFVPHVSTYRAARVRISGRRPLPARADSIDIGVTPVECRVRARSLKVVVGPDFGGAGAARPSSG